MTVKTMWRRALFVMCLGAGVAVDACGNETFSADPIDDAGADASTSDAGSDTSVNDASNDSGTDGSSSSDGSVGLVPIISGQNNPHDLFVRGGTLFWTNYAENDAGGTVMAAALDGSGAHILSNGHHPNRLAVDSTNVYWTDFDNPTSTGSSINETSISLGVNAALGGNVVAPMGIAVDDDWVYVAELYGIGQNGTIWAYSKTGVTARRLAQNLDSPVSVAVDNTNLVWTEKGASTNSGKIVSSQLDGGILSEVTNLQGAWDVDITAPNAFVTAIDSPTSSSPGIIYRALRNSDAGVDTPFENEAARPYFITVAQGGICWTCEGDGPADGAVRCGNQFPTSPATAIASGQARPHGIAVDTNNYVYWTSYSTGKIYRSSAPFVPTP